MESATLRRPSPRALARMGLVALLLTVAAVGWALTADRMRGMDAGPGTDLGGLSWFIVAWVTMMAAMMLPLVTPIVLAHARIKRERKDSPPLTSATALFIAGYLFSWGIAGVLGYMIVEGVRSLAIDFLAWENGGPYVAGGVLLGAALYQLTPLKDACLRECRSPRMLRGTGAPVASGRCGSGSSMAVSASAAAGRSWRSSSRSA